MENHPREIFSHNNEKDIKWTKVELFFYLKLYTHGYSNNQIRKLLAYDRIKTYNTNYPVKKQFEIKDLISTISKSLKTKALGKGDLKNKKLSIETLAYATIIFNYINDSKRTKIYDDSIHLFLLNFFESYNENYFNYCPD